MKYPKHLFLTYGSYESQWWSREDSVEDLCSPVDRAKVLEFSLAALHYPPSVEPAQHLAKSHDDFEFDYPCRDAVWSLALALDATIEGKAIINHL